MNNGRFSKNVIIMVGEFAHIILMTTSMIFCRSLKSMEQTISDFLCNTCRVRPKPSIHKFSALYYCINAASLPRDGDDRSNDRDYSWIATSSGSASEFFIEPMLSCINDYDVMYHRNDGSLYQQDIKCLDVYLQSFIIA
jgi:hypothetical protein